MTSPYLICENSFHQEFLQLKSFGFCQMLFLTLLILPGECILLGSVLSQQRLGVMDIKALSAS